MKEKIMGSEITILELEIQLEPSKKYKQLLFPLRTIRTIPIQLEFELARINRNLY